MCDFLTKKADTLTSWKLTLAAKRMQGIPERHLCPPEYQDLMIPLLLFSVLKLSDLISSFHIDICQFHIWVKFISESKFWNKLWAVHSFNSVLYNTHLVCFTCLGTVLLDDQLMNICWSLSMSLELKKAIWPQHAFVNFFLYYSPRLQPNRYVSLEWVLWFLSLLSWFCCHLHLG